MQNLHSLRQLFANNLVTVVERKETRPIVFLWRVLDHVDFYVASININVINNKLRWLFKQQNT